MTSIVIFPPVVYKFLLSVPYTANSVNYSKNLETRTKTAFGSVFSFLNKSISHVVSAMAQLCGANEFWFAN